MILKNLSKIFMTITLLFCIVQCSEQSSESNPVENKTDKKIITVDNVVSKANFIKNNLKLGKSYKISDDLNLFRNVLIGNWSSPPREEFKFKEDGKFILKYLDESSNNYKKRYGIWKIENDSIFLKYRGEKWNSYKVNSYGLDNNDEYNVKYYIHHYM